ncbi:helix-turn-helix domain-containing protein [Novosphingobium terrae]|jgi:cytoskeleton protein RodZ|uniref:helix-turn-helix domain-containing protein n=1 Tax=Novosphingobium terrae TaxID=2726189 RepID=UPI00197F2241|nr:helix-turn-helix domain-containing protein [Novosphingobium terrae]
MGAEDKNEQQSALTAGGRLRVAREAAGLSLAQLAEKTRIREKHLEALEAGDFAALPGRTYALGFARTYARAVGLDDAEITSTMRAEYSGAMPEAEAPPAPAFTPGDPARVPSSGFAWVAGVLALIAAVGGYVWWNNYYSPAAELPSLLPADTPTPQATASGAPAAPAPAAPAQPSGDVVFTAQGTGVWVRFYDGDKTLVEKVLQDGESYTVPADAHDPKLRTGHPELLTITIGGQSVPKISEEMKTVKDVPVTAAALNARGNAAPAAQPSAAPGAQPSGQPAPQPSSTPGASPSPSASATSGAPAPHHVAPRPRRHKTHGETVTAGGVLPAGVPLITPPAANGGNP